MHPLPPEPKTPIVITSERRAPLDAVQEQGVRWAVAQKNVLEAAEDVAAQPVPTQEALAMLRAMIALERTERTAFEAVWHANR